MFLKSYNNIKPIVHIKSRVFSISCIDPCFSVGISKPSKLSVKFFVSAQQGSGASLGIQYGFMSSTSFSAPVETIDCSLLYIELHREINLLDTYHVHVWESRYVKLSKTILNVLIRARVLLYMHMMINHMHTVWQHLIHLVLRRYERKSYRGIIELLREGFYLRVYPHLECIYN